VRTHSQPGLGWTVVLRRQPVRIVEGRVQGGYTDAWELVCCDCGDHPDLDYRDVSPTLQRIRGPYPFAAGVAGYEEHVNLCHRQPAHRPGRPVHDADGGSARVGGNRGTR
jgi:hypothetical protein